MDGELNFTYMNSSAANLLAVNKEKIIENTKWDVLYISLNQNNLNENNLHVANNFRGGSIMHLMPLPWSKRYGTSKETH